MRRTNTNRTDTEGRSPLEAPPKKLWLQWSLATAIAGAIVGALETGGWQFFATLFLSGMIVGTAQWFFVRRYLRWASWWIVASTVGWVAGVYLQLLLNGVLNPIVVLLTSLGGWEVLWINVVKEPVTSTLLGLAQWLVLQRSVSRAYEWIAANFIAGVLHGAISATVCYVACQPITGAAGAIVATGAIVYGGGWLIHGVATGWVLKRSLQHKALET